MAPIEIETPHGPAYVHLHPAKRRRAALVLGHGAGGGIGAGDLVAAADEAVSAGLHVALVEQPYRVAGRRSPAPAKQLDAAWTAVVEHLHAHELTGLPIVVGGRSLGARVACRTRPRSAPRPSSASPSLSCRQDEGRGNPGEPPPGARRRRGADARVQGERDPFAAARRSLRTVARVRATTA